MAEKMEWLGTLSFVSDGRYFTSVLPKKGAKEEAEFGGLAFKTVEIDPSKPLFPVSVSTGRTINLGDYEFARVDVGVDAVGPIQMAHASTMWAEQVAEELLAREVAMARDKKRDAGLLPAPPDGLQLLVLKLGYGLTLNLGNFDSARIDVGCSLPSNPSMLGATWAEMEEFVSKRISDRVAKIRAKPKSDGF